MSGPPTDGTTTRPDGAAIRRALTDALVWRGSPEILRDEAREALDEVDALLRERDEARAEKGAALELLGEEGAGGAAAGLVPAIHNLASQRDKALHALAGLLAWAERHQGGDPSLTPEEWYIERDYCRIVLGSLTEGEQ